MAQLKTGTTIGGRNIVQELDAHLADNVSHIAYGTALGTNDKTISLSPAPSAYVDGMALAFKNVTENTGAVTINVNGLGAKSILKSNGSALTSGNLKANSVYTIRYNGTNFILQGEGGDERQWATGTLPNCTPMHATEPITYTVNTLEFMPFVVLVSANNNRYSSNAVSVGSFFIPSNTSLSDRSNFMHGSIGASGSYYWPRITEILPNGFTVNFYGHSGAGDQPTTWSNIRWIAIE